MARGRATPGVRRELRPQGATAPPPERRQLTLVFIDIVDSTALSECLDPEEFFAILRDFREICDRSIGQLGGRIGGSFGDGLLAYFGVPRAHEDDAERAVRAALSIASIVRKREFDTGGWTRRLAVRIAVNTGLVMVGRIAAGAPNSAEIFGTAAHVAARLQAVAGANEVLVGPATYELVRGAFHCAYLGKQTLKGVTGPIGAWKVQRPRESESRFARARTAPLTPMIGRQGEGALLRELWRQSVSGAGRVAMVSGDPGIGKSRLVQEFRDSIASEEKQTLYFQCSPLHVNTPLSPEIERLRRAAGLSETDAPAQMIAKLRALLATARFDLDLALPYYGALLSIPACLGYRPADLGSMRERNRALAIMIEITLALARSAPLLMIVEDAQWLDPTSTELLERLLTRLADHRIFLVVTHRRDWSAPWAHGPTVHPLPLARLEPRECEEMINIVIGEGKLPRGLLGKIVERTDGVPLFIEEFTRAVAESGVLKEIGARSRLGSAPQLPEPFVPTTLKDSLMERLDRLGTAKRTAQMASVFGRCFTLENLLQLTGLPRGRLFAQLEKLETGGLLRRLGGSYEAKFAFRHAMIQEAAYDSLLKDERRALHAAAATALRAQPDRDSGHLAVLGYHCARAGLVSEAVEAWLEAAGRDLRRTANREAIASLQQGLELVVSLPSATERCAKEIELQLNLALAYTALAGWQFPAVDRSYARALELCRDGGTLRQKSIAFWGLTLAKTVNCELNRALAYAQEFVALAEDSGNEEALLMAHTAALIANFFLGRLNEAQAAATEICARYDPAAHGKLVQIYQHDPKIVALIWSGHIEWILGHPRNSRACCEEARRYARELGHPFMLALALILGASDHLYEYEAAANLAVVEEGIALAREHGFRMYEYFGPLWAMRGVAARSRDDVERLSVLVSRLIEKDCYLQVPLYQIWLAEEWARLGRYEMARTLAADAEAVMQRTGERWFEPELYRIAAGLLCRGPGPQPDRARELLTRALASARTLGAAGWQLRAAIDLAQLLANAGDGPPAETLLREAKDAFGRAETSADLRRADDLLEKLRAPLDMREGGLPLPEADLDAPLVSGEAAATPSV